MAYPQNSSSRAAELPPYYDRSSSSQPTTPETTTRIGSREDRDPMDLVGQIIQIDKHSCRVRGKVICGGEELYALESDTSLKGYNGLCPKCGRIHVEFHYPSRGYYVATKNLHDMVHNKQLTEERSKGRKEIRDLVSIEENLPPLDQAILGKNKGIEGDSNSCYMDATIFCMFAYNNVFDSLIYMETKTEPLYKLQKVLRENIVHALRDKSRGFVERDALFHFRAQLSEAKNDPSFKQVEKDPSEFLQALEALFHYAPLKTISPDQPPTTDRSNIMTNIIWSMFDTNPSKILSTNIASIFRNSLKEIPAKLATIPPFLVLVAERPERSQRPYRYIIPDRQIALDNNIVQLVCLNCKTTNHDPDMSRDFFFCDECYKKEKPSSSPTDATVACYCRSCLTLLHQKTNEARHNHNTKQIALDKHKLNLFAVLCIKTSHYVAFVKCQNRRQQGHEWLFFDSMSDREYDERNIPLVASVPDFDLWIDKAEKDTDQFFKRLNDLQNDPRPTSQKFNEHSLRQLRLFCEGAFFFYENSSANYQ